MRVGATHLRQQFIRRTKRHTLTSLLLSRRGPKAGYSFWARAARSASGGLTNISSRAGVWHTLQIRLGYTPPMNQLCVSSPRVAGGHEKHAREVRNKHDVVGLAAEPSNKGLKLTSVERIGRSQLNPSVRPTGARCREAA